VIIMTHNSLDSC